MELEQNEPTNSPSLLQGIVTNNTHFVDNKTGTHYGIDSVIGYDKAGGQQTYYAWRFPEGHPARGFLNATTGKIEIN